MRGLALVIGVVVAGPLSPTAWAAGATLTTKQLRGVTAEFKPGTGRGVFVWTDEQGLHLRWAADGKPVLFSGKLELDRAVGKITRVNPLAGGWVTTSDAQILLFSATATDTVDGFDLALEPGTPATLTVAIDEQPIDLGLLWIGTPPTHPAGLPLRFTYR